MTIRPGNHYTVGTKAVLAEQTHNRAGGTATRDGDVGTPGFVLAIVALLCAAFSQAIGVYSVFGAFLCGVAMPRGHFNDVLRARISPVTVRVLLPMFFVYAGLNTHFSLLLEPHVLAVLVSAVLIAFAGKGLACALGARGAGATWGQAASVGALLNARGLMELVLLSVGLERGHEPVERRRGRRDHAGGAATTTPAGAASTTGPRRPRVAADEQARSPRGASLLTPVRVSPAPRQSRDIAQSGRTRTNSPAVQN